MRAAASRSTAAWAPWAPCAAATAATATPPARTSSRRVAVSSALQRQAGARGHRGPRGLQGPLSRCHLPAHGRPALRHGLCGRGQPGRAAHQGAALCASPTPAISRATRTASSSPKKRRTISCSPDRRGRDRIGETMSRCDDLIKRRLDRIYRVEVIPLPGEAAGDYLLDDIAALGITGVDARGALRRSTFCAGDLADARCRSCCATSCWPIPSCRRRVGAGGRAVSRRLRTAHAHRGRAAARRHRQRGRQPAGPRPAAGHRRACAPPPRRRAICSTAARSREDQMRTIAERLLYNEVIQYYDLGQLTPHVGVSRPHGRAARRDRARCASWTTRRC